MTTVTDSDIKDLKALIGTLGDRLTNMDQKINELDKKVETRFAELDKKVSVGFAELSGKIETTNAKIDGIDKRLANQEFIYRAVILGIIGTLASMLIKSYWQNPMT